MVSTVTACSECTTVRRLAGSQRMVDGRLRARMAGAARGYAAARAATAGAISRSAITYAPTPMSGSGVAERTAARAVGRSKARALTASVCTATRGVAGATAAAGVTEHRYGPARAQQAQNRRRFSGPSRTDISPMHDLWHSGERDTQKRRACEGNTTACRRSHVWSVKKGPRQPAYIHTFSAIPAGRSHLILVGPPGLIRGRDGVGD